MWILKSYTQTETGNKLVVNIAYWSEKQRQAKFNFSAEELRPYFPLPRVLEGIFSKG